MAGIPIVCMLEVGLDHSVLPVSRTLELPRNLPRHELHPAIQVGIGWKCNHFYKFRFRGKGYEIPEPITRVTDEVGDPRVIKLMNMELKVGESLYNTYDFGDSRDHPVTLKGISRQEYGFKTIPRCSAAAMACPPEDIGEIRFTMSRFVFLNTKRP